MKKNLQNGGFAMEELVIVGFSEKLRALEVLTQLQRLRFEWSSDLHTAVAVQVEEDGRLRLHHSQLLDPQGGFDDALRWKAILSAIVPLPHMPSECSSHTASRVKDINAELGALLGRKSFDLRFLRDAAAILCPGNSAILAILRQPKEALVVLNGYSPIVLHTELGRPADHPMLPSY